MLNMVEAMMSDSDEEENENVDEMFVEGDLHNDGKKRKQKVFKKTIGRKRMISEQCKNKSTFIARLKEAQLSFIHLPENDLYARLSKKYLTLSSGFSLKKIILHFFNVS